MDVLNLSSNDSAKLINGLYFSTLPPINYDRKNHKNLIYGIY